MKFSRYNVFAQNGDALFILNTLHGNFAKVIIDVDKIYSALMGDRESPQCHIGFMKKITLLLMMMLMSLKNALNLAEVWLRVEIF